MAVPDPGGRDGALRGRVAIVAGSSPSINAGIADALAEEGAVVGCLDADPSYAKACAAAIESRGGRAEALVGDVTDEDDVRRCVELVERRHGPVDVLVSGAAIESWKGLRECTLEDLRRHLDVIVGGAFLMGKHCAESMIRSGRGGSIVNLASTEGHQGRPGNLAYGTAKGALLHLTRCMAMELAPFGIRVNSLTPTGTDPAEGLERAAAWGVDWHPATAPRRPDFSSGDAGIPLGRRPSPRHYGRAAVFLASQDSAFVTGIDLPVDGGVLARYWRWSPGTTEER